MKADPNINFWEKDNSGYKNNQKRHFCYYEMKKFHFCLSKDNPDFKKSPLSRKSHFGFFGYVKTKKTLLFYQKSLLSPKSGFIFYEIWSKKKSIFFARFLIKWYKCEMVIPCQVTTSRLNFFFGNGSSFCIDRDALQCVCL